MNITDVVAQVVAAFVLVVAPQAIADDAFKDLSLIRPAKETRAVDFTLPSLGPQPIRLKDERRKVVLLNFWATWCSPCKEEMPSMERLYRRYRDRGFTILAVSLDSVGSDKVRAFAQKLGLTFPIALDPKMEVAGRYTVRALPSTFLVDRSGATAAVAIGPRDWDGSAARAVTESLLR